MKNLFVAFLLISLAVSLAFGETDPNSVHPGYKKAIDNGDITTAVNLRRNGISDIYCPASLSSGDAVKLYRNELRSSPETIMENCSPEFIEKIAVKSCANPKNIKLCKAILGKTNIFLWSPMLEKIIENEVYNESPYFNKEMDMAFSFLADSYEFYNPFSWSASVLSLMEKMKIISSSEHRDGASACFADISCSALMITNLYVKNSIIPDEVARFSCRIHPGIDKKISEEKGLNILNCDDIFALYSDKCGTTPQIVAKNRLDGQGVSYYKCDGDSKGWHRVDSVEAGKGAEPCTDDRVGELKQSELDSSRIFRCGENHQWNTYAFRIGNVEVAPHNLDVGGKTFTLDNIYFEEENQIKAWNRYSRNWGHIYEKSDLHNVCPDGWRLPNESDLQEIKQRVDSKQAVFPYVDYSFEDPTGNDELRCIDMYGNSVQRDTSLCETSWTKTYFSNNAYIIPDDGKRRKYSYVHPNVYWGMGKNGEVFVYGVDNFKKRDKDRNYVDDVNFIRCVKSDNNLGKVKTTAKKRSPVVAATSSTADDEIAQRKERLKNQKQESASDAAVSVTQDDDDKSSISTTKLLRIAVFSAVAVGGAAAAYMFDKKAKDATATPPTNEQEFKKGHDDAKQNQNVRNISLGVAAAGLVALGISILF
ncbi:hypothetical protein [Fibrobacter sp.]|uniref:hypothetical protein n=1 Tax=Fibrobacter sp. TaxID=35828 RepID=UPI0026084DFD|nr:hypothetical protein [Fibrobacter sp.]MDD5943727.1 hypothetical protein [Fibrobacter sp.]